MDFFKENKEMCCAICWGAIVVALLVILYKMYTKQNVMTAEKFGNLDVTASGVRTQLFDSSNLDMGSMGEAFTMGQVAESAADAPFPGRSASYFAKKVQDGTRITTVPYNCTVSPKTDNEAWGFDVGTEDDYISAPTNFSEMFGVYGPSKEGMRDQFVNQEQIGNREAACSQNIRGLSDATLSATMGGWGTESC